MYRYRSYFWPGVLILAGVVALLANTGLIPADRLFDLVALWPLILIVIGLELIVRRTLHGMTGDVAAALIVLLAIVGAATYLVTPISAATHTRDFSSPVGELTQASVEINVGAANITISGTGDIGSDLYRAHIEYSGPAPDVTVDRSTGAVTLDQRNANTWSFPGRRFVLNLQLSLSVPWTITENSAATTDKINLAQLHLAGLTLNTAASTDDITLGTPNGIVPVQVNGAALTVHFHRPGDIAASVTVSGAALSLDADGRNMHAVGDLSYESPGFAGTAVGYQFQVNGAACTVTLDKTAPSG